MNARLPWETRTFLVFETAATEIDDLDRTLRGVAEEDVLRSKISTRLSHSYASTYLWLQITVHNTMVSHQRERLQHLVRKPPDETGREPMEVVRLDQLVEVDAQELRRNAQMATEVEMLRHLEDVVLLVRILPLSRR